MEWFKNLPQIEGDFLWVDMWGCDCCIARNGIVTIKDVTNADDDFKKEMKDRFIYLTSDAKIMAFFGPKEDMPVIIDGEAVVTGWLELTSLPQKRD